MTEFPFSLKGDELSIYVATKSHYDCVPRHPFAFEVEQPREIGAEATCQNVKNREGSPPPGPLRSESTITRRRTPYPCAWFAVFFLVTLTIRRSPSAE